MAPTISPIYREFDSPIRHLLHTNFVPSDVQCNDIRALLDDSLKSLDEIDAEMARLEAQTAQLLEHRQKLCADISAHQAMVSPARRLPRDIIQEIFVACLPTDRNAVIAPLEAPNLLGQICHGWRYIALSTASLWSSLHVVIPGNMKRVRRISEAITIWLSRSGALPLSITVVMSRTFNDAVSPTEIFTALCMFAHRWKKIQFLFALGSDSLMESLASLRAEDVPLLERILMCSWNKDFPIHAVPLPILEAPSLRSASVNFFGYPSNLPAEWHSLTELHLNTGNRSGRSLGFMTPEGGHTAATTYLAPSLAIDILRRCPNLTTVSLEVTHGFSDTAILPAPDPTLFGAPVTLSHLTSFSVSFAHRRPHDAFFETLLMPQLERFEFTGCVGKMRVPFHSTLTHTGSLTELSLRLRRFRVGPVLECLKFTSELTKLKLSNLEGPGWGSWFTDESSLSPQPHEELLTVLASETSPVCPRLTSMELDGCTLFSDAALSSFLKRRLGNEDGTAPLKNFRAVFSRQRHMEVEADLLPLEPGVTVSLSYPPTYVPPPPQSYSPWEGIIGPIPYFNHEDAWPHRWQ